MGLGVCKNKTEYNLRFGFEDEWKLAENEKWGVAVTLGGEADRYVYVISVVF